MQADYFLVHFPYATRSGTLSLSAVSAAIQRLTNIQRQSGTTIICEPKLGDERAAAGIGWLRDAPRGIFSSAGLGLCWDVGDHLLGARSEADYFRQLDRWRSSIKVVHLHNVRFAETKYRWTPPHPSRSQVNSEFDMRRIIKSLPQKATIVSEYTPQRVATEAAIETSFSYLKALTQEEHNA
jgi:sugar phosphate isomerase/epimerase